MGAVVVAIAVATVIGFLYPGSIPATAVDNPFGASALSGSEAFLTVGLVLTFASLPVALLLAVAAVIVRVRRSEGIERAQLKWFVGAVLSVVVGSGARAKRKLATRASSCARPSVAAGSRSIASIYTRRARPRRGWSKRRRGPRRSSRGRRRSSRRRRSASA